MVLFTINEQYVGDYNSSNHYLTDDLTELRSNGFWAAIITIGSFAYGEYFIASTMPPDIRQESWIMMQSAVPHLIFSLLYVAGVTWWGPQYMSTRKPISGLRPYMMAYNAFQVTFSAYMFTEVSLHLTGTLLRQCEEIIHQRI